MTDVAPFGKSMSLQDAEALGQDFFKRPELVKADESPPDIPESPIAKSPEHHLVERGWHGTSFNLPHKDRTDAEHHFIVDMHHKAAQGEPKSSQGDHYDTLHGATASSLVHGHFVGDVDDEGAGKYRDQIKSSRKAGHRFAVVEHNHWDNPLVSTHKKLGDALSKYHSNVNTGQQNHDEEWAEAKKHRGAGRVHY